MLHACNLDVIEKSNSKRIDICIYNYELSIKYSKSGAITLHNSNSCINKDISFTDLLLLTPKKIYLITNEILRKKNIDINNYLKNTGDSLKLKRSLLTYLSQIQYEYMIDIDIQVNQEESKNTLCSKVFYKHFSIEYEQSLK